MPWKESHPMCERAAFIRAWEEEESTSMSALCRRFGVSRPTGYKWLVRFLQQGEEGLLERSRAPVHHVNAICSEMERAILAVRDKHNEYGPKKIRVVLGREWPEHQIPASSTIGDILKRNGVVPDRKFRRRSTPSAQPLAHATEANKVWCADFKGWFCTQDGQRIDPLTVTDAHTRYLLACQEMRGKTDTIHVKAVFDTLFRAYGLPERIRTDNGPPFASVGLSGISRLSAYWIRLGIVPERIRPATPSDNGRHERFHLTLKKATASPAASTRKKQQEAFDRFRKTYNEERPHEALGQKPPAMFYKPSFRPFPHRVPNARYGDDLVVRRVRGAGQIKWRGRDVGVTTALAYEPVGLQEVGDGLWLVFFCSVPIGLFDERKPHVLPLKLAKKYGLDFT